jgi:phage antirepressor YoqD-like protein
MLSLDMAKELAMVQRTDKGKEARLYFIACEQRLMAATSCLPQNLPDALRAYANEVEARERLAEELKAAQPAIAFHETLSNSDSCVKVEVFAKAYGMGRNTMFKRLRLEGFLIEGTNLPYQNWLDMKLFKVIETIKNGIVFSTTLITGKGQDYLIKIWS